MTSSNKGNNNHNNHHNNTLSLMYEFQVLSKEQQQEILHAIHHHHHTNDDHDDTNNDDDDYKRICIILQNQLIQFSNNKQQKGRMVTDEKYYQQQIQYMILYIFAYIQQQQQASSTTGTGSTSRTGKGKEEIEDHNDDDGSNNNDFNKTMSIIQSHYDTIVSSVPTKSTTTTSTTSGIYQSIYQLLIAYKYYCLEQNYNKVLYLYNNSNQNQNQNNNIIETSSTTSSILQQLHNRAWEQLYHQALYHSVLPSSITATNDTAANNNNNTIYHLIQLYQQQIIYQQQKCNNPINKNRTTTTTTTTSKQNQQDEQQKKEFIVLLQLYTNYITIYISYLSIPYVDNTSMMDIEVTKNGNKDQQQQHHDEIVLQIRQYVLQQQQQSDMNTKQTNKNNNSNPYEKLLQSIENDLAYTIATYYLMTSKQEYSTWLNVLYKCILNYTNHNHNNNQHVSKYQFSIHMNYKLFREYYWNNNYKNNNTSSKSLQNYKVTGKKNILFPLMNYNSHNNNNNNNMNDTLSLQQQCVYNMNDAMLQLQPNTVKNNTNEHVLHTLISSYMYMIEKSNISTNTKRSHPTITSSLTNVQLHIIHYNIALYQYYCHQYTNCQQTLQQYFLILSNNNNTTTIPKNKLLKKKKKIITTITKDENDTINQNVLLFNDIIIPGTYYNKNEQYYWECYATILYVYCMIDSNIKNQNTTTTNTATDTTTTTSSTNTDNATTTKDNDIKSMIQLLDRFTKEDTNNLYSTNVYNHVLLYTKLHQTSLLLSNLYNNNNDNDDSFLITKIKMELEMLLSLPETLRNKPIIRNIILKHQKRMNDLQDKTSSNNKDMDNEKSLQPLDNDINSSSNEIPTISNLQLFVQSLSSNGENNHNDNRSEILLPKYIMYGDFAMSHQRYTDAATIYKACIDIKKNSDSNLIARYVRALSYVQPNEAVRVWSSISNMIGDIVPDLIGVDDTKNNNVPITGAELEVKEIIFTNNKSNIMKQESNGIETNNNNNNNTSSMNNNNKKKSHDAILRQRAKKREKYIQSLEQKSSSTTTILPKPDPERWISKYERSNYMKYYHRRQQQQQQYNNNNQNKRGILKSNNAQGIVSQQEMAKLDVVAHQQAIRDAAANTDSAVQQQLRSTAHMNVSGKNKGGKKRR